MKIILLCDIFSGWYKLLGESDLTALEKRVAAKATNMQRCWKGNATQEADGPCIWREAAC